LIGAIRVVLAEKTANLFGWRKSRVVVLLGLGNEPAAKKTNATTTLFIQDCSRPGRSLNFILSTAASRRPQDDVRTEAVYEKISSMSIITV